jgi:hypothetical protein
MTGRADEVAQFVEHVVGLWKEGSLDDAAAAAMLEGYLGSVHEGLGRHLGCTAPSCCVAALADTAPPVRRYRRQGVRGAPGAGEPTALGTLDGLLFDE